MTHSHPHRLSEWSLQPVLWILSSCWWVSVHWPFILLDQNPQIGYNSKLHFHREAILRYLHHLEFPGCFHSIFNKYVSTQSFSHIKCLLIIVVSLLFPGVTGFPCVILATHSNSMSSRLTVVMISRVMPKSEFDNAGNTFISADVIWAFPSRICVGHRCQWGAL